MFTYLFLIVQDAVEGLMKQAADEVDKQNVFYLPALFAKTIAQTCHCDIVSKFSIPGRSWAQHGASWSTKRHHRTINSGKTWWWGTCNSELNLCQRAFQWTQDHHSTSSLSLSQSSLAHCPGLNRAGWVVPEARQAEANLRWPNLFLPCIGRLLCSSPQPLVSLYKHYSEHFWSRAIIWEPIS